MSDPLRLGLAGLGTVGIGTLELLETQRNLIEIRCGKFLEVTAVSARDRGKDRGFDISKLQWHDDPVALATSDEVDIVVELMGGTDGAAKTLVETALAAGKPVVTANKALMAHHGAALAHLAESSGASLHFEAAVAGGIPVIKALREGLAGNRIHSITGILNGTSNYILTTMRETGRDFGSVLADAQALGYAEADPSFDIDGVDAAHKLALLTALAFGCEVDFPGVYVEGIRNIGAEDIAFAEELGYRIKLLAIAECNNGSVFQRVHPCLVDRKAPIASVDGVFNAVVAEGDYVGTTLFEGRGAGAYPTASAVVADIIDVARGQQLPTFSLPVERLNKLSTRPMAEHVGAYYLRLACLDEAGVIADITATLRDENISVETMVQRGRSSKEGQSVPVVITTHETNEAAMLRALARIEQQKSVLEPPHLIRIEAL
ncbi:homoserine dehydrogenase [Limibacillus sp. MBR-115]|jgi:homoserine dehydrogenase|uniref:homoserine dehydrogenase n=1 Tax=Limibacillus sp. MBR-115 TaxID=3156465 RepID=UPI00339A08FB